MSRIIVNYEGRQKRVSCDDAARQAGTMRLILDKLSTQPGVVLCDEVGMGKTYVALGVAAQYLKSYPRSRVLILTPSVDLAEKWLQDLERFRAENVNVHVGRTMRAQPKLRWRVADILGSKDKSRVWVVPISIFFHSRRRDERRAFRHIAYQLISRGAFLSRKDRKILWRRLGGSARSTPRLKKRLYWNGWRVPSFRNRVHDLLEDYGYDQNNRFDPADVPISVLRELRDDIRWVLTKARLRRFSLIVVDEAHHFRNPDTKRYRSLERVFEGTFRDMLFLTATPFQLGPDELEHIMRLFRLSSEHSARGMEAEAGRVSDCAHQYQNAVLAFERALQQLLDTEKLAVCEKAKTRTPGIKGFCAAYEHLQGKHTTLQDTLSKWVIRNVKERPYRQFYEGAISLDGMSQLPFTILQRLLYEYQRKRHTFSATQNVSLTSSWEAFRVSAVMNGSALGSRSVAFYRKAMKTVVSDADVAHPKFKKLLDTVQTAFRADEKVLVFTSRIATVRALQTKLERVLQEVIYRDIGLPRRQVDERLRHLRKRTTTSRDSLWLVFQENYFRSCLRRVPSVEEIYPSVLCGMYRFHSRYRIGLKGLARSPHWRLLSHLCEWAVFGDYERFSLKRGDVPPVKYWRTGVVPYAVDRRVKPLRRLTHHAEEETLRRHYCSAAQLKEWIAKVLNHESIWDQHDKVLAPLLDIETREDLLAAITRVLLVPEVVGHVIRSLTELGRGKTEKAVLQVFEKPSVKDRITRFLTEVRTLPTTEVQAYTDGLATENLVARASGNESATDRLRHRYGFNAPFRPYVLIASEVMQEGLDLHRECSRLVHYDLAWNPARLEQRVGRIDRLGSLVDRQLRTKKDAKLHIHRHYIPGTIDERMFKVVCNRERWFKFILGHRPEWENDPEGGVDVIALPEAYSREFRIQLGTK